MDGFSINQSDIVSGIIAGGVAALGLQIRVRSLELQVARVWAWIFANNLRPPPDEGEPPAKPAPSRVHTIPALVLAVAVTGATVSGCSAHRQEIEALAKVHAIRAVEAAWRQSVHGSAVTSQ